MTDLIDEHLRHIAAGGLAPDSTVDDRRKILRRLDRELPYGLEAANAAELEAWFVAGRTPLGRPWSRKTRATYHEHIAAFYRWACNTQRGMSPKLNWNPFEDIPRPRTPRGVPRPALDSQVADVLARADRPWRTAVLLAAYAGMRVGEIAVATREQVSMDLLIITGKGGRTRVVPRHPMVADEAARLEPGRMFRRPRGGDADGDWLSGRVSDHLTELGYPLLTAHMFRHWFATTTLAACGNLRVVQELLGHSDPATTAVYTQITDEQRRFAVGALPVLAAAC